MVCAIEPVITEVSDSFALLTSKAQEEGGSVSGISLYEYFTSKDFEDFSKQHKLHLAGFCLFELFMRSRKGVLWSHLGGCRIYCFGELDADIDLNDVGKVGALCFNVDENKEIRENKAFYLRRLRLRYQWTIDEYVLLGRTK